MRLVLDTNVLIDGFQDDYSAPYQLLQAVQKGEIIAVVTPRINKEYRLILRRLIADDQYRQQVEVFMSRAKVAQPQSTDIVIDDEEDRKFLEAALGGDADMIVTNDRHLLDIGEIGGIPIRTPQEAWIAYQDQTNSSSEWQQFAAHLLGLGKK